MDIFWNHTLVVEQKQHFSKGQGKFFPYMYPRVCCDNGMPVSLLQRLQSKVLKLVDVSYGGENGFNQVSLFLPSLFNTPCINNPTFL